MVFIYSIVRFRSNGLDLSKADSLDFDHHSKSEFPAIRKQNRIKKTNKMTVILSEKPYENSKTEPFEYLLTVPYFYS